MVRWPDAKFEVTREEGDNKETERPAPRQQRNCETHAKKFRSEEKRSREERRDSLETKQIENSHFTDGKVKQNHKIFNIPITILAKKTAEKH